jgi:hypothetical protein
MNGTKNHHIKWNKPDWERQVLHVLSHMQILGLKKMNNTLGMGTSKGERWKERIEGDEYDQSTSYTHIKME